MIAFFLKVKQNISYALPAACLLVCCLVYSCKSFYYPDPTAPEDPGCALLKASEEGYADGTFRPSPWFEQEWWHLFSDKQLDELIYRALNRNPRIKVSEAEVWLAAAEAKITAAPLYPTLDLSADLQRTRQSQTGIFGILPNAAFPLSYTQSEILSSFNYEIDWWGKNRNALRAALGELQAAFAETAQAKLMLSIALANAYFEMQVDMTRAALAKGFIANLEKTIRLYEDRQNNGLDSTLTLNAWRTQLQSAKNSLEIIEQDLAISKNRIRMFIAGSFLEEFDETPSKTMLKPPFPLPSELPMDLLAHRPDVAAQIWRVESAGREIQVARALFYPNINLMSLLGYQSILSGQLLKWKSWYGIGEPSIHLPIFEGGRLTANLEAREYDYVIAVQEYEDTLLHAVDEVLNAVVSLQKLSARLADQLETIKTYESSYELTKAKYQRNLSSGLDLLSSERDLLIANDNLAAIQGMIARSLLALIQALGGGYDGECS